MLVNLLKCLIHCLLMLLSPGGGKEVIARTQTKASLLKIIQVKGNVSWDSTGAKICDFIC